MKNIELKVKVSGFNKIIKSLKAQGAEYLGALKQKDVYFDCNIGRLKIREINNKNFELIFYQRPDKLSSKLSEYSVVSLKKEQSRLLKNILSKSNRIKTIVIKNRKLWLFKHTRIHLDYVNKVGKFLEIETVLGKITKNEGAVEYQEVYDLLQLSKYEKISKSYSDLMMKI